MCGKSQVVHAGHTSRTNADVDVSRAAECRLESGAELRAGDAYVAKVIDLSQASTEEQLRAHAEARMLGDLYHPNIIRCVFATN
jgi:hypothetical protein